MAETERLNLHGYRRHVVRLSNGRTLVIDEGSAKLSIFTGHPDYPGEADQILATIVADTVTPMFQSDAVPRGLVYGLEKIPEEQPETEAEAKANDPVRHPAHYGGADNPYEAIKVIEAWELGFHLGNVVKYVARCGKKADDPLVDLRKAKWYLDREISNMERGSHGDKQ